MIHDDFERSQLSTYCVCPYSLFHSYPLVLTVLTITHRLCLNRAGFPGDFNLREDGVYGNSKAVFEGSA